MASARIVHDLNCLEFCSDYEAMHTRCCRVLGFATSLQGFEVSLLDDKHKRIAVRKDASV